jgi:hypothetical protein
MPVGNDFYFHYTDIVAMNDRYFPEFEGELQHTDRSPPLEFQVAIRQWTTEQGSPASIHLRTVVEDRRLDGLPVPDRTGGLVQMNQAASDERGTEKDFSPHPVCYALILDRQSQFLFLFLGMRRGGKPWSSTRLWTSDPSLDASC